MSVHATVYRYISMGGEVAIEDGDMGSCTIASSRAVSVNELRRRAAKKLRAMADRLEADAVQEVKTEDLIVRFSTNP